MTTTRSLSPNRIIALVCIAIFIGAMDLTVASAFLPQVVVDFELNTQQFALAGWVVTMYLAAYAVSMTFAGRLSDLYGRRPAYLVCLVIFIAGSILVALTRTTRLAAVVCAGMAGDQPRDSGVGRGRDGARLDGAGRRSVSTRTARHAPRLSSPRSIRPVGWSVICTAAS